MLRQIDGMLTRHSDRIDHIVENIESITNEANSLVAGTDASLPDINALVAEQGRTTVETALEIARLNKQIVRALQEIRKIATPFHPYVG